VCSNPAKTNGTACTGTDHCNQTYTCDANGACGGSNPKSCTDSACMTGGTCNPTTGNCEGGANKPDNTVCDDSNICTINDHCASGACVADAKCALPQTCDPNTGNCTGGQTIVNPQAAKSAPSSGISGVAMDLSGNTYITSAIFPPAKTFDSFTVTSFGSADVLVAKYDPSTHTALWAKNYGAGAAEATSGASDQYGAGIGVTLDNTVAVIGNFYTGLQVGGAAPALTNPGSSPLDFLIGLDASGVGKWAKSFNEGSGGIYAIATDPNQNLIAICGSATQADTDLVPGATYGGATVDAGTTDIVIAMFDSNGNRLWAKQIGQAGDEECDTLAIDSNGDLYAAGKYDNATGTTLNLGLGALHTTPNAFVTYTWVAKFQGSGPTAGTVLENAAFYGAGGLSGPNKIALDSQEKLVMVGNFSGVLSFDPTATPPHPITAVGTSTDGFVAKLDPAAGFARLWSVQIGGAGDDAAQGVAVTSTDDVVVVGFYQGATVSPPSVAALTYAGGGDAYTLKLSGIDGALQFAQGYGDSASQSMDRIAINSEGSANKDLIGIGGIFYGTITFPAPAGALTHPGSDQIGFLEFATLAP
jgi:hypothetical protein